MARSEVRYEGRGESLESFAPLPTPIANRDNRFERATRWPGLEVFCLPLALGIGFQPNERRASLVHSVKLLLICFPGPASPPVAKQLPLRTQEFALTVRESVGRVDLMLVFRIPLENH